MKLRVAVLGCGPAGMIAAHAAAEVGCTVRILSANPQPSQLFGAQYLHAPIARMTGPFEYRSVRYVLDGTLDGYKTKVYEGLPEVQVSPATLSKQHLAWDLRATYNRLWDKYADRVEYAHLDAWNVNTITYGADLVISSVPRDVLCYEPTEHEFKHVEVWASGEAPEWNKYIDEPCPMNTVICNGKPGVPWYRISNIYGRKTMEWSFNGGFLDAPLGIGGEVQAALVKKPLSTDCNCHGNYKYVGRFGAWNKATLSHDAFGATVKAVHEELTR